MTPLFIDRQHCGLYHTINNRQKWYQGP